MGRSYVKCEKDWPRGDPSGIRGNPPVSGVLTITLNVANRLLKWFTNTDKVYIGVMRLHEAINVDQVYSKMKEFETTIYQTPPMMSAVKRSTRKRHVYSFVPLESEDSYILFKAHVEAGTYIRKLCYDVGEALGVGISMVELRRIKSGLFDESQTVTLNQLAYAASVYKETGESAELVKLLNPVEELLVDKRLIVVKDSAKENLYTGASLAVRGVLCVSRSVKTDDEVFVCSENGELIEVARSLRNANDIQMMKNGIVATPIRVLEPINGSAGVS
ncbi:MAG: RNA-guided pseudouridylation complex pseudouridine synthase subunit Cbf5 [Thermoprotei archaeon]